MRYDEITKILPHRYPFLFVDKVTEIEYGKWAKGIKLVSSNENFFNGHFKDFKVMPGVLILEAMAQLGAIALLGMDEYKNKLVFLAGVNKARFKKMVLPGDVLKMHSELIRMKSNIGIAKCYAKVDNVIVAECEIMFGVQ